MKIESKILTNLVYDEEYCRKVLPFIKAEYFAARPERVVVEEVVKFFSKFNKPATKDILKIEIGNRTDLSEVDLKNVNELINGFSKDESHDEWLIQSTEKFCKDRAVYNAILESIGIIDGKDQKRTQESIPNILSDALAVSFDNHVGHDYILDADARYEYYHRKEDKVAFDIELLNKITAGGLSRKSLSCILAQTGGG
ncbi:MAG: DNA primase, partial [Proteobacteria bacterium]|nr:DNA primase [Pseudomonadota bacterium]